MKWNEKRDLTRWNRAGLSKFRYIDGNAITYLETLRQQLVEEYDRQGVPSWRELVTRFPELPGETRDQTRKRLQGQYYDERRDYAWEILRSFARSAHVLGEYIDAYANEGYLSTAVEWDNVRKLVAMLGYRPSPPASAETHLALLFKKGKSGELEKGFAVKNKPAEGKPTVIFETRERLTGSDRLNQLHLKDWDRNFTPIGSTAIIHFPLRQLPNDLSIGDLGVLATSAKGLPVKLSGIDRDVTHPSLTLQVLSSEHPDSSYLYHNTRLYLQPALVASPLANGKGSALVRKQATLAENEIVFGKKGANWRARRVAKNELRHLQFAKSDEPLEKGERFFRATALNRQTHPKLEAGAQVYVLPHGDDGTHGPLVDEGLNRLSVTIASKAIKDEGGVVVDRIYYIKGNHGQRIYYPAGEYEAVAEQVDLSELRFAGKASDLESGGWALVVHQDQSQAAYAIGEISEQEEWFSVKLSGAGNAVSLLRSAFKLSLRPRGHDNNASQAWSSTSTDTVTIMALADASQAAALKPGRKLICAGKGYAVVVEVELKEIVSSGGLTRAHLSPPFHLDPKAAGLTRHDCILHGNVVQATHGETQPEKIVGNGDASQTGQSFELPSDRISWVVDAGFTSGVRADLTLRVGERVWQQVEDLFLSSPEDPHYQVKVNEDGVLSVCFGDGRNGRRLPTGIDNVRVGYRTGYGEEGNLAPNTLVKIARPDPLVEGFVAPLGTSGGAEKESSDSMRESAPPTVLALERAVSLDDFTHLAAHHSMVWQARAFEKMPDRPARPLIEVVVVPAGGTTFTVGSQTAERIRTYLEAHAAPGTPVSVVSYQPLLMALSLSIMVDEAAYDKKQVESAVREHLQTGLALKQRRLGQSLFRSEVIALLEQVAGVENGHCEILDTPYQGLSADRRPRLHRADDGGIRRVSVRPQQLLYLDADTYPLTVSIRRYEI